MAAVLIDAGPLVAILNQGDDHHESCVTGLKALSGPLVTTWAAFTEAMYLLGAEFGWHGQRQLWDMYWQGAFEVAEPTLQLMTRVCALMEKYRDVPMDLADASLVALAEERSISTVFSIDQSGFQVYKLHGRKHFRVFPQSSQ